jgi:ribosomal 50S subunit-recycling heat shock protein
MATDYDERQARWTKREQAKENEERKGEVKVGEALGKATGDIRKTDDAKVRIDNVETLSFKPSVDLKKGDSIRVTIEADWTRRGQKKQGEERKGEAKVGEALGKATGDIRKTGDVRVRIDNVETLRFKPSVDLKKGDSIRVTIEKV